MAKLWKKFLKSVICGSLNINNITYLVKFICAFRENSNVTKWLRNLPMSSSLWGNGVLIYWTEKILKFDIG